MDGPLVNRPDGEWARLVHLNETLTQPHNHPDNYIPDQELPSGALLVVRTSAQRERDTLLVIIAALAEVHGIDVRRVSKAAMEIESATIRKRARVSARAIEDHLRRIPDALERKAAEDEPRGAAD